MPTKDVEQKIDRLSSEIQKLISKKSKLIANGAIGFFAEYVLRDFGYGNTKSSEFNAVIRELWEVTM